MDASPRDGVDEVVDSNVEICQRALDAFNRGGMEDALHYIAAEVEVYDPDLPPGSYRGHDAVRRIMRELMSGFRDLRVLEFRTFPAGDRVVGLARTLRTVEYSDLRVEMSTAHTLTFHDGKIVYWRVYLDQREALADAGLDTSLALVDSRRDG
jgi:ketosteroid isomerase-like protein